MNSKNFLKEGFIEDATNVHLDHEVQMAREECYHAAEHALVIHKLLRNISEQQGLEGWVSSKITLANDYLNTVREHLEYELLEPKIDDLAIGLPIAESEQQGVAEGHADQQRKIFKRNGKPVGEVGIDRESSPGVGQWYMKCYAYDIDNSGYDSYEEAVAELKHCLKQGVAESSKKSISEETNSVNLNPQGIKVGDFVSGRKRDGERYKGVVTKIYRDPNGPNIPLAYVAILSGLGITSEVRHLTLDPEKYHGLTEGRQDELELEVRHWQQQVKKLQDDPRALKKAEKSLAKAQERLAQSKKNVSEASLTGKYRPKKTAFEKFRDGLKKSGYDMEAAAKKLEELLAQQSIERRELDSKYADMDKNVDKAKALSEWKKQQRTQRKIKEQDSTQNFLSTNQPKQPQPYNATLGIQKFDPDNVDPRTGTKNSAYVDLEADELTRNIKPTFQATDAQVNDPNWMRARGLVPMQDLEAGVQAAEKQNKALGSAQRAGFPTYQHQGQTYGVMNPKYGKGGAAGEPKPLTPQQVQQTAGTNIVSGTGAPVTAGSKMLTPNQRMGGVNETSAGSVAGVVNPKTSKPKNKIGSLFGGTYTQKRKDK